MQVPVQLLPPDAPPVGFPDPREDPDGPEENPLYVTLAQTLTGQQEQLVGLTRARLRGDTVYVIATGVESALALKASGYIIRQLSAPQYDIWGAVGLPLRSLAPSSSPRCSSQSVSE
jgi:hypothetical protein